MRFGRFLAAGALLSCLFLTACAKKTADIELDAAKKAIDDARKKKAGDCDTSKPQYMAAEAAIAEAQRLAEEGNIEEAKARALEAQTLAEQASAAAKPGCGDKPKEEDKPEEQNRDDEDAAAGLNINLDGLIETIYFDYNDASIREDSKQVLSKVADALSKSSATTVEIEGHCDVRGSTEYNLHLGERRARAVEKYMTTAGVNPKQIQIISYGEERPVDLGDAESAHQKNRRAELHKMK
jgi:peptidoglycan-associated lipoprotein